MDLPLPSTVVRNGHCKSSVYMERCSSASPPPPYDDAVREDVYPSTIDQTVMHMERTVEDAHAMMQRMKGNLGHFQQTKQALIDELERSAGRDNRGGDESSNEDEDDDDNLGRITQSLQQLIEQAQTSLQTRMAVRDPTCMTVHRSVSCPQLTAVFDDDDDEQYPRRQSTPDETEEDTRRRSLARASTLFDEVPKLRDQQERYLDSQWRLTVAMQELVHTVNTCHPESSHAQEPSFQHLQPHSTLQRRRTARKAKQVHHHHHHHHYHSSPQIIVQQHSPPASISMSHVFTHIWSSFRSSLAHHTSKHHQLRPQLPENQRRLQIAAATSSCTPTHTTAAAATVPATTQQQRPAAPLLQSMNERHERMACPLARSNVLRLMFFATLLLFSFMHPTSANKTRCKKIAASQQCVGQFINASSERLPVSTWVHRSCLVVYILTLL